MFIFLFIYFWLEKKRTPLSHFSPIWGKNWFHPFPSPGKKNITFLLQISNGASDFSPFPLSLPHILYFSPLLGILFPFPSRSPLSSLYWQHPIHSDFENKIPWKTQKSWKIKENKKLRSTNLNDKRLLSKPFRPRPPESYCHIGIIESPVPWHIQFFAFSKKVGVFDAKATTKDHSPSQEQKEGMQWRNMPHSAQNKMHYLPVICERGLLDSLTK